MAGKGDWKRYRDFVLRLEPGAEGTYRVSAQAPGGGVAHVSVRLPFDEKDVQLFIHRLGHKRLAGKRGAAPPQPFKEAISFGHALFNTIISEDVRLLYSTARHATQHEDHGLRLQLCLSDTPQLADLPWEFLHDGDDFVVLDRETPLVRYLDLKDSPRPMVVQPPLRILVTISDPEDLPRLKVDDERAKIEEAVRRFELHGALHVKFTKDARVTTLYRTLRRARAGGTPYHVWHYVGHGTFDPDTNASALLFCDRNHRAQEIGDERLGTLFKGYPDIRLILLNACEAARPDPKDPFAGVAAGLVKRGVPAVIGMQFDISDEAAIRFSSEFYRALVDGFPVDAALTEARLAVYVTNWTEWATPVLLMRAPDGRIFDLSEFELPSTPSSVGTGTQPEDPQSTLETLYTDGLASFFTKKWDSAVTSFTRVAQRNPNYGDVVLKLEEATKQGQLARLYAQGSEAFESQAWPEAVESFQAVLDLDAGYEDAANRLDLAQRHSTISDLYRDAQQLHQAQQYQAVVNVFDDIHQLDPDFADPDGLLGLAREGLARQEREKKVSDLQIQALLRMDEQDWLAARQLLDQIRELEPDDAQREALRIRVEQELDPSWQPDQEPSDLDLQDTGAPDDIVEPKPVPGIGITLSAKPRKPRTGAKVKWTATVKNTGETDLFDVTIKWGKKRLGKPFFLAQGQKQSRTFTTSYGKPGRKSRTVSVLASDPHGETLQAKASYNIKVQEVPEPKPLDQTPLYLGKTSVRKKPPPPVRLDPTVQRLVTRAELPKGVFRARRPAEPKEPDPLVEKILALLAKKASKYDDFYVHPGIPEKKRNNARSKCDLPYGERVLGLIDFTVWGSAKNALVFGEKAIYYHNGWLFGPGAESLRYSKFPKRKIKELFDDDGEPEEEVSLGKGQVIDLGASDVFASDLVKILNRIKKLVKQLQ